MKGIVGHRIRALAPDDGSLVIGYRSSRRLCGLAHGFIECTPENCDHHLMSVTAE